MARGLKMIGRLSDSVPVDRYHDSDLLFFGPLASGEDLRSGWYRGRAFRLRENELHRLAVNGICVDDYVFVATAIGEDCFK